ncbi:hypothetical protein FACS1894190_12870 [Spirochaetia bacterium]|nr:hypothetical protein FACS1894190_12870 [Spirochaetia bacterium]
MDNKKSENKIGIIALNDIKKTAVIAEVKRNKKKINTEKLLVKKEAINGELADYKIELKALSLEDM